jgi:multiple sugar transport system substrate-binding protein
MKRIILFVFVAMLMASMLLTACGGAPVAQPATTENTQPAAAAPSTEKIELRYMLWDANQLPPYRACSDAFTKKNPNITVKIDQMGWDEYWKTLQTEFVTGNGPDVFADQLSKFPEFANKNQLVDIQPMVDSDKVDVKAYVGGLTELWAKDGKRYGLPKDWDSIAVIYNKAMLDQAGLTVDELNKATWNPKDGGTFQQIIAKLSVDKNGKNGLDPAFDAKNVARFGFFPGGLNSATANTSWSNFAHSNGWIFNDGPWATKYYYDDPKLVETVDWFKSMIDKGFIPPYADQKSLGNSAFFAAGDKVALTMDGSWMIGWYQGNTNFAFGFAMLPEGPQGRKSMFNGLADSIWVGSKHQAEAWQYLKFLSSQECEDIVGTSGVVFPAYQSSVDLALAKHKSDGLDVSAFTNIAKPETTFRYPIADHASEVEPIMNAAFDSIYLGEKSSVDALKEANAKVNDLFK